MGLAGGGGGGGGGGEQSKMGKAALTAFAAKPPTNAEAKAEQKRADKIIRDANADGSSEPKGEKDTEEEEEDPIMKAEREFFEIIKQVNEHNCIEIIQQHILSSLHKVTTVEHYPKYSFNLQEQEARIEARKLKEAENKETD